MTETEATYKTAEPLPECETGSVERLREAAIEGNKYLVRCLDLLEPWPDETDGKVANSQTQLLRNILAKIRGSVKASVVARGEHEQRCPQCNADIGVLTQLYSLDLKYIGKEN